jgi:hypothetical protein
MLQDKGGSRYGQMAADLGSTAREMGPPSPCVSLKVHSEDSRPSGAMFARAVRDTRRVFCTTATQGLARAVAYLEQISLAAKGVECRPAARREEPYEEG